MTNNYFTEAQVERWTSNFEKMRIDRVSVFENTPAVINFNFEGKAVNIRRFDISDGSLNQVADGRNPTFTWDEVSADNRRVRKIRFIKPIPLDGEEDIAKTLADPENEVIRDLRNVYLGWKDIQIRKALTGSVLVGNPFTEPLTSKTAAQDEVITINAQSTGLTKDVLLDVRSNFIRNQQIGGDLSDTGIVLVYSQAEEKNILDEEAFTNKDYYAGADARDGSGRRMLYGMRSIVVAGNESGKAFTVKNPVLEEINPTDPPRYRNCLAVSPRVRYFYEGAPRFNIFSREEMMRMWTDGSISTSGDPGYFVNTVGIVFSWDCAIIRVRGEGVQIIQTPL
jgi:hypothetical protein